MFRWNGLSAVVVTAIESKLMHSSRKPDRSPGMFGSSNQALGGKQVQVVQPHCLDLLHGLSRT
jgi:hypothetical protein